MSEIIFTPFIKAYNSLSDALTQAKTDLEKDGAIQRFEFCYELSWKMLKRVLNQKGIMVNSPREVFREAARENLIDDPEKWFKYLEYRNLTVHTYNEDTAEKIFNILFEFKDEMNKLKNKFKLL